MNREIPSDESEGAPYEQIEGVTSGSGPPVREIQGPQERLHAHEDARSTLELLEPYTARFGPRAARLHGKPHVQIPALGRGI